MTQIENDIIPIEALSMLSFAIEGALDAAQEQLGNLERAKSKPHVLDDELINRIIDSIKKQNNSLGAEKAVCLHWMRTSLSKSQVKDVERLLSSIHALERVNSQVLFLANHFKDHTLDKILARDDVDLALDFLSGKLYPPVEKEEVGNLEKETQSKKKDFKLPPDVTSKKKADKDGSASYYFRHEKWGELGRIDLKPVGGQSRLTAFGVLEASDSQLAEMKEALFRTIVLEFTEAIEGACGSDISKQSDPYSENNMKLVESKLMVCETCNKPVALLIFAPDARTSVRLEDYASMMFVNIRNTNLPTWIIGEEEELKPDEEGIALILKIWPDRKPARRISSLKFEPMLAKLQTTHCKNRR